MADGSIPADPQAEAEARSLTPAACTTRAFHGSYLRWAFDHVRRSAPARVQIFDHRATARALDDAPNGCQAIRLAAADGRELTLTVDAVVLAQGHVDMLPDAGEDWFAGWARARGLVHVPASNPADVNLDGIAAGEPVLIRGLGLNFFDYVAMLTTGRGGRYERAASGRLRYLASGREPVLFAGSGRGVPQPSSSASEPPSEPLCAPGVDLAARLRESAGSGPIDFRRHIWPLALHEIGRLRNAPAAPVPVDDTSASQRDVDALVQPASGLTFRSPGEYREWAARLMHTDLRPEGARPEAVGRALSAVRRQVRDLAREGRISGRSFRDHVLGTFASLDNVGAEGPQTAWLEELSALMDSAVVCLVGPHMLIEADEDAGRFAAYSPAVSGSRVVARCLIEAHLPAPDIRRTSDPLLRHLAATGQIRQRPSRTAGGLRHRSARRRHRDGGGRPCRRDAPPAALRLRPADRTRALGHLPRRVGHCRGGVPGRRSHRRGVPAPHGYGRPLPRPGGLLGALFRSAVTVTRKSNSSPTRTADQPAKARRRRSGPSSGGTRRLGSSDRVRAGPAVVSRRKYQRSSRLNTAESVEPAESYGPGN